MSRTRVLMIAEQLRRATSGGIGTYVLGLLQGLGELESESASNGTPGSERPEPGLPDLELLASRQRRLGSASVDPLSSFGYPVRSSVLPGPALTRAWDRGLLRASAGFDVVHAVSLATLEPNRAALVCTVHDLLWRRVPEAFPARGRAWHEAALHRALRRSARFVVPSTVVAEDLYEAGARPATVTVIPMGSDHLPPPDPVAGEDLLHRIGVTGPFLLSVGTLEPRKNILRLVEAYRSVRGLLPEPWPLVIVGPTGWGERPPDEPGVVFTGTVTAGELSALYAGARLLAYVPLVEGFGIPPIEAMVVGTPAVTSPLPSVDGAAYEVDPYDTESIANGLVTVATDDVVRARLRTSGRRRAGELRWSNIAQRHCALWNDVAEHHERRHG